jgi:hypothetical protein
MVLQSTLMHFLNSTTEESLMQIYFYKLNSVFVDSSHKNIYVEWDYYNFDNDTFHLVSSGKDCEWESISKENPEAIWVSIDLRKDLHELLDRDYKFDSVKFIDLLTETKMLFLPFMESSDKPVKFDGNFVKSSLSGVKGQFENTYYLKTILTVHNLHCTGLKIEEMVLRAEFIKASVYLEHKSEGFPVDCEFIENISKHRINFVRYLQSEVNRRYGEIYVDTGVCQQAMVLNQARFAEFISNKGYEWNRTETNGSFQLDQAYLKSKANIHSELKLFYQTQKTLQACQFGDLFELVNNGHIKPQFELFNQKTGRTSPIPSRGFILNLPAWIRSSIKPKKGKVFIGVDWVQQEIAIAAALSNDRNYIDLYNNKDGDVYLALAKMAGAAPPSATKVSHSEIRQIFKAIQLGIGYGKGLTSLANDIYSVNFDSEGKPLMSREKSLSFAEAILNWHKTTFNDYWCWLNESAEQARNYGYMKSLDGWTYLIPKTIKHTQLINFPMQANGAAMLRRAVIHAAKRNSFDLVCTLHDALYVNADESQTDFIISEIVECMNQACYDILQGKIHIRTDVSVYTADSGYHDERGDEVLKHFHNFVRMNCSKP